MCLCELTQSLNFASKSFINHKRDLVRRSIEACLLQLIGTVPNMHGMSCLLRNERESSSEWDCHCHHSSIYVITSRHIIYISTLVDTYIYGHSWSIWYVRDEKRIYIYMSKVGFAPSNSSLNLKTPSIPNTVPYKHTFLIFKTGQITHLEHFKVVFGWFSLRGHAKLCICPDFILSH